LGANNFREYSYDVMSFDRVIEFDGHYVFKFNCEVTINGEYLLEKFRVNYLDEKYKNKERKK